jgi:FtsP/CotA-like multicopper oxidase with cupredoxin domain
MRALFIATLLGVSILETASAQLPRLAINDNRAPAGVLKDGVLKLDLQITAGIWHPDAENDPGVDVLAIGEVGRPASVPGPLIRVPKGTTVRTTLRNTLSESMMVFGLTGSRGIADSVRLAAGEVREFTLTADRAGNFSYGVMRAFRIPSPENPQGGNDMVATGAFIVDEPGVPIRDRVIFISMMVDTTRIPLRAGFTSVLATLNGKSWPHTERFTHDVGDSIVWRVINGSLIPHPMHLHGFYFDVLSRGTAVADSIYTPQQIRKAVTERMPAFTTMTMRWVPDRPGNWLFHCHLTLHTQLHAPLGPMKASEPVAHAHDALHGMSNLMMGVMVRGAPARAAATRRRARLAVEQINSLPGDVGPRFRYTLNGAPNTKAAGPVIVIQKDQPTAITVVNKSKDQTAVHWHGIELESFNDGVAGFGGHSTVITPLIEPGDSFVARMTPPRAGTFIYHTHVDELRQQRGGLYGALLVIDPKTYDPTSERVIVVGSAADTTTMLFNGEREPNITLDVGKTYRLRIVQIMTARPLMHVVLLDDKGQPGEWTLVAKDGADLPEHQKRTGTARQNISNGETHDVLFTPRTAGVWRLEGRANNGTYLSHMTLTVR